MLPPMGELEPFKGRYFVKRAGKLVRLVGAGVAGKKGGDAWVALRPVPLPLRTCLPSVKPGRRKRPHSTPPLSRPYDCDDLPQKPTIPGISLHQALNGQ